MSQREEGKKKCLCLMMDILRKWDSDLKRLFQIVPLNLKKEEYRQIIFAKTEAIISLPSSGTFFFRIPRHHEHAQELKSPVTEYFQNSPPVYRCRTQGLKKTKLFSPGHTGRLGD